jgi:hypothetical protein
MAFPLLLRASPLLQAPKGSQQPDPGESPAVPVAPTGDSRLSDTLLPLGMVGIVALGLWMSGHGVAAVLPFLLVVLVGIRFSAGSGRSGGGGGGGGGCGGGGCGGGGCGS